VNVCTSFCPFAGSSEVPRAPISNCEIIRRIVKWPPSFSLGRIQMLNNATCMKHGPFGVPDVAVGPSPSPRAKFEARGTFMRHISDTLAYLNLRKTLLGVLYRGDGEAFGNFFGPPRAADLQGCRSTFLRSAVLTKATRHWARLLQSSRFWPIRTRTTYSPHNF